MFFVASKIFWLVAQPLSVVAILTALGVVLVWRHRRRLSLLVLILALSVHFLASFTNLGFVLIQPLEDRYVAPETEPATVSTIVVLGGATLARPSAARHRVELNEAGDRLTEALRLARIYPQAILVLSGGSGVLGDEDEREATIMQRFLVDQGIDPTRMRLDDASRNTAENVTHTRDLLADRPKPILLITSAFHMPRAVGLFEAAGIPVVPWPVDYRSPGQQSFRIDFANPVFNLSVLSVAVREWIGLWVYQWSGRISVQ